MKDFCYASVYSDLTIVEKYLVKVASVCVRLRNMSL